MLVSRRVLALRSLSECIDAINWASKRRPVHVRPAWIGALVDEGRARLRAGVCVSCACTDAAGCWPPCAWVSGTKTPRTLCTACDIDGCSNPIRNGPAL
ncbi:MAG: hypothetical protein ACRDNM_00060 [Gaiellaceae bacterium]